MADAESGLDVMRSRIKRASRKPPPPRRPADESTPVPPSPSPEDRTAREPATTADKPVPKSMTPSRRAAITLAPNGPAVNLAIRVRRPLDDRLVDIIHALRQEDVRSSKVELIEMLLWELPEGPNSDLRRRLSAFRKAAPRGSGSSAEL